MNKQRQDYQIGYSGSILFLILSCLLWPCSKLFADCTGLEPAGQ